MFYLFDWCSILRRSEEQWRLLWSGSADVRKTWKTMRKCGCTAGAASPWTRLQDTRCNSDIHSGSRRSTGETASIPAAVSPEHIGQEMPWPLRLLLRASRVWRFVSRRKRRGACVAGLRRQQQPADKSRTRRKTPGQTGRQNKQWQRGGSDGVDRAAEGHIRSRDQLKPLLQRERMNTSWRCLFFRWQIPRAAERLLHCCNSLSWRLHSCLNHGKKSSAHKIYKSQMMEVSPCLFRFFSALSQS